MRNAHFFMTEAHPNVKKITTRLTDDVKVFPIADYKLHLLNAQVLLNLSRLKCRFEGNPLQSEAEVRYAICDPILSFVCDQFQYLISLEDTVEFVSVTIYSLWQ